MLSSFLSDESDNCRLCNLQTRAKAAVVKKLEFTRTFIALFTFFQRFWYFWFLSSNLFLGLDLFFIGFFVFLILVSFPLIGLLSFTLFLLWFLLILTEGSLKIFANQITISNGQFADFISFLFSSRSQKTDDGWWVYFAFIYILSTNLSSTSPILLLCTLLTFSGMSSLWQIFFLGNFYCNINQNLEFPTLTTAAIQRRWAFMRYRSSNITRIFIFVRYLSNI